MQHLSVNEGRIITAQYEADVIRYNKDINLVESKNLWNIIKTTAVQDDKVRGKIKRAFQE